MGLDVIIPPSAEIVCPVIPPWIIVAGKIVKGWKIIVAFIVVYPLQLIVVIRYYIYIKKAMEV